MSAQHCQVIGTLLLVEYPDVYSRTFRNFQHVELHGARTCYVEHVSKKHACAHCGQGCSPATQPAHSRLSPCWCSFSSLDNQCVSQSPQHTPMVFNMSQLMCGLIYHPPRKLLHCHDCHGCMPRNTHPAKCLRNEKTAAAHIPRQKPVQTSTKP